MFSRNQHINWIKNNTSHLKNTFTENNRNEEQEMRDMDCKQMCLPLHHCQLLISYKNWRKVETAQVFDAFCRCVGIFLVVLPGETGS